MFFFLKRVFTALLGLLNSVSLEAPWMIAAHRKGIAAKFSMQLRKLVLQTDKYIGEAFRGDREWDNWYLG